MSSPDSKSDKPYSTTCPNCDQQNAGVIEGLFKHQPDKPGKQYNPYSTNTPMFVSKEKPLASSNKNKIIIAKKEKKTKAKDTFVSDEIKQCPNERKIKEKVDYDDITKSCLDLEIDG